MGLYRKAPMLRYRADCRTLFYLAFTTALTVVNWKTGKVHPVVYPVTLFMFFTTAVISHNHNHLGMWRSKALKDRKSTRLNSSHANISYAVFCLKKKKIK